MASIEEAKDIIKNTSISTIISFYHPITKKGANFEAICPFHGDSHPSLKINDSKGIYKCFACGAAGDSIKFVQDKLNLDFIEAIKDIAKNLGIDIEEKKFNKNPKYEMGLRVLQAASKLYRKVASEHHPEHFMEFLKKRNLTQESVDDFQIGYAPSNNALMHYLGSIPDKEKEMAMAVAKELGLIRDSKRGQGHYDFYRDRIMFPVWDHTAKVRGFSSRAVLPNQKPKYLNSGESFIFDKGNILYGFNLAKSHIRDKDAVIVVEGNMDVISLHQFGFKNSVATQGVALSQSSVRLLSNMTENIYLGMDSDNAGIIAMTRINSDFLSAGIIPKYIDYSPSKDPDEFLNQFGRLELQKRIEEAPTFLDFLIQKEIPESIPASTDQKLRILEKVFHILKPLGAGLLANEKVIQVAKSLGLRSSDEDIINEFKSFLAQQKQNSFPKSSYTSQKPQPEMAVNEPILEEKAPDIAIDSSQIRTNLITKAERILLETLLSHPECVLAQQMTEILDKIQHFEVKRIVQWLRKIYLEIDESEYPLFVQEKMKETLPDEIKKILASSLFNYRGHKLDQKVIEKMLGDLNKKLDESQLKNERDELRKKQLHALSDEEGLAILNEIQQIESKLLALRNK